MGVASKPPFGTRSLRLFEKVCQVIERKTEFAFRKSTGIYDVSYFPTLNATA